MDPVANMIVTIKNGYMARKNAVAVPYSKFKLAVAKSIEKEGFIGKVQKNERVINIELIYEENLPKISEIKQVSKQGMRVYTKSKSIKAVKGGRGTIIVSTPQGLMGGKDAKKKNLGGEVICRIW